MLENNIFLLCFLFFFVYNVAKLKIFFEKQNKMKEKLQKK